jgi:hypothetical protein
MNKKMMWLGAVAMMGLAGCAGDDVPIGDDGDLTKNASPLLASWTGYVELYEFRSGSDAITIDIDTVNGTEVTGHVTFGDGALLAAPQDPDVGYPQTASFFSSGDPMPYEGFRFAIRDSKLIDGERLQFTIQTRELWNDWCALQQTTYPADYHGNGEVAHWSCSGDTTSNHPGNCRMKDPATGQEQPVDCLKAALCDSLVCECDEDGCSAPEVSERHMLVFDLQMTEDHGDGSITGLESDDEVTRNLRVNKVD